MKNLLTKYLQIKRNNADNKTTNTNTNKTNRKTIKHASKLVRKPNEKKHVNNKSSNVNKNPVVEILMNSPKIKPIYHSMKNPKSSKKLRKSGKSSKKGKKLKEDFLSFNLYPSNDYMPYISKPNPSIVPVFQIDPSMLDKIASSSLQPQLVFGLLILVISIV